ncbi:MAG: aminotransferase class IV [Bilophila wadsworthia]
MIPVLDTNAWIEKLRELERPGADNILAFYEHRFGAICRDPRLMLAPLDDHLVHRGDGVFETIRFTERKVIHLDAHLRRLANSAAGLSLTLPCPIEEIRDIVLAVAKATNPKAISASCPDAAPADSASRSGVPLAQPVRGRLPRPGAH